MNPLKIVIQESNLSLQLSIEMYLEAIGYEVSARTNNWEVTVETFSQQAPDLLMIGRNSGQGQKKQLLQQLAEQHIPIIWMVSDTQKSRFKRKYSISNIHFFTVALQKELLRETIEQAIHNTKKNIMLATVKQSFSTDKELYIKKKGAYHQVPITDILYIQANDNYINIQLEKDRFVMHSTLKDMKDLLAKHRFLQVHRSYLVNYNKIDSINFKLNRILTKGHNVPISRRMKRILMNQLKS